jgi:hypothetical protein
MINQHQFSWKDFWFNGYQNEQSPLVSAIMKDCLGLSERPIIYDKVFVITGLYDNNFHHFMIDSLTRLGRHITFLRENPDIKIHIRTTEERFILDYFISTKTHVKSDEKDAMRHEALNLRRSFFNLLDLTGSKYYLLQEIYHR